MRRRSALLASAPLDTWHVASTTVHPAVAELETTAEEYSSLVPATGSTWKSSQASQDTFETVPVSDPQTPRELGSEELGATTWAAAEQARNMDEPSVSLVESMIHHHHHHHHHPRRRRHHYHRRHHDDESSPNLGVGSLLAKNILPIEAALLYWPKPSDASFKAQVLSNGGVGAWCRGVPFVNIRAGCLRIILLSLVS